MKPDKQYVNSMDPDQLASLVNSVDPDQLASARCELVLINQNRKYRIVLVQGQVNRNFPLLLNEMGPDRTSRAWYFHSPANSSKTSILNHDTV